MLWDSTLQIADWLELFPSVYESFYQASLGKRQFDRITTKLFVIRMPITPGHRVYCLLICRVMVSNVSQVVYREILKLGALFVGKELLHRVQFFPLPTKAAVTPMQTMCVTTTEPAPFS